MGRAQKLRRERRQRKAGQVPVKTRDNRPMVTMGEIAEVLYQRFGRGVVAYESGRWPAYFTRDHWENIESPVRAAVERYNPESEFLLLIVDDSNLLVRHFLLSSTKQPLFILKSGQTVFDCVQDMVDREKIY